MGTRTIRAWLLAGAAFAMTAAAPVTTAAPGNPSRPQIGSFGFDTAGMDRSVKPGDDFVRFANGQYLEKLSIPADRSSWGMFVELSELSLKRSREILEQAAANPTDEVSRKAGTYYATYADEAAIEAKGTAPLKPLLADIDAIRDRDDLARYLGRAQRTRLGSPINLGISQDAKQPGVMAVSISQGGLGMPDRDYYLKADAKFADTAAKYRAHVAKMLTLAGISDADAKAARIYELEKKIAEVHWDRVQSRQAEKRYNPIATAELANAYPGLNWQLFMRAAGVDSQTRVIVSQTSAVKGEVALLASEPVETWKDYLTFRAIARAAPFLPKSFVDEGFAFNGRVLSGTPELAPRWKRAVELTNGAMGEAVGQLYVAKYFTPETKAKMDELVRNILAAMDARLQNLSWMAPETKEKARAKLAAFTPKIGYPSKWRDYSALEVRQGDALGNALRATEFEFARNVAKLGKPIDRTEWGMTPMTVNAYANPTWNEIVFPAAILQPPFFDPNADPAVNYGAIGAVIGHEISHHFDDQGSKYDKTGALSDWWTKEDIERFKQRTDQVVAQYGAYEPLPGSKVNGGLTLGENIGDLAGITIAYDAYKRSLNGKPAPVLDGLTGDQRFFLAFAQVWRNKYRDAALLQQLTTDPHTPGHFRPYVVRNIDAWYDAFDVRPGDKLYLAPDKRARVW
ncbi:MAG: M13-type metalloendopeptidase [Sphingomonadaceae bacterium]|nr:M13-type metalloendopeptidase [Sphingomonadaceae bacterium]